MRMYSQANVMQEYLSQPVGKFGKLFNAISRKLSASLTIKLPHRIYLKGELISETVSEK